MDKIVLKFFSDVLYLKGVLCFEELDAIMDCSTHDDLDVVFEKMMKEEFNNYRRGDVDWERLLEV